MTRDDITRMAREAGFVGFDGENKCLREFAALVVAAERDACARLCADYTDWCHEWGQDCNHMAANAAANECANAIRARGMK